MANTSRMNRLEELGRVDAEKAFTKKGKRNLKDEKKRIVKGLKSGGAATRGFGIAKMNRGGDMMYSRGYGVDERSKRVPTTLLDRGPKMKKGGSVKRGMKKAK